MLSVPEYHAPSDVTDRHWRALFRGEFYAREQGHDLHTCMGQTMHYGPLRVQRPFYPEGSDLLHMYLLHPPGGLVGGDQLSIQVRALTKAKVLVTTPSAGKLYRNESDMLQGQEVDIQVADGAVVEYLPQENIIFNGAKGTLNTRVNIEGSGLFIGWEITCLGRPEGNQFFEEGQLKQSLMLYQDGRPLFLDRLHLDAQDGIMQSKVGLQNKLAFATCVVNRELSPDAFNALIELQQVLNQAHKEEYLAVTQKPGVLIIRVLGNRAEPIRNLLEAVWRIIRPALHNREVCIPRIWNT